MQFISSLQLGLKQHISGVSNFHAWPFPHDLLNSIAYVLKVPEWDPLMNRKVQDMINQILGIVWEQNIILLFAEQVICASSTDCRWRTNKFCRCQFWGLGGCFRWIWWRRHTNSYCNFCLRPQTWISRLRPCMDFLAVRGGIRFSILLCPENSGKLCSPFVGLHTFLFKCLHNFIWVILQENQLTKLSALFKSQSTVNNNDCWLTY